MRKTPSSIENEFDHHLLIKLFPLAICMVTVYTPYSFFITHDYFAGISEFIVLLILIFLKLKYNQLKDLNIIKDILIVVGFPVLIPWLISGGPANHGLWWAPVYVLWISYFAKGKRYIGWLLIYVFTNIVLVTLSSLGLFTIAYSIPHLLHLLFAFSISATLIYYYEAWRNHYKLRMEDEFRMRIQTQDKYKELLASAPDAIMVLNPTGEIVLVNEQAERVFGFNSSTLVGSDIQQFIPHQHNDKPENNILHYVANPHLMPSAKEHRFVGKHKEGHEFPIELSLNYNQSGNIVTAIMRDVSERHLMVHRLLKQNALLNDFARMASHDIRGPVGNLKSLMYFLHSEPDIEEQKTLLRTTDTVITNLEDTLNNLLTIVEQNNHAEDLKEISFETLLQKLLNTYAPEIQEAQARITSDFSKAASIKYSYIYLESIMQNLLSNALKYRSPNRTPVIRFESDIQQQDIVLKISDNGLGIDLNQFGHKVFGLKQTFHRHPSANGIGLYLIKSHIESLGGDIHIDSEVDKGTSFTIFFKKQ